MTADQTKSAVILLWICAWNAYSHFLVNLLFLNLENKHVNGFVNPFPHPGKPEWLSQAGILGWRPVRVLYLPGKKRRRNQDPSKVYLHSWKPSWELGDLNQRRREEEHGFSLLFSTCAVMLSPLQSSCMVSMDICTAGSHSTMEPELLLWHSAWGVQRLWHLFC